MFFQDTPSIWLGQGIITLRGIKDPLPFYTRWTIGDEIVQEVEIKGITEKQVNLYTISGDLLVTLENEELGLWKGQGTIEEHHLSWTIFSSQDGLRGEEHFYHLASGRIKTRASFFDKEGTYTLVEGEMWRALKTS